MYLFTVIFAVEELLVAAFFFSFLDFRQVSVDQVPNVVRIESAFVVVDHFLEELEYVFTVFNDFVPCQLFSGEILFIKKIYVSIFFFFFNT